MGNACDCAISRSGKATPPQAPAGEQKTASGFRYFAYGSNLCGDRLRMRNKSARLVGTARLDGYRLDFTLSSLTWRGAAADIVADEGGVVWGVVWELDDEDAASLDGQEGVWRVQGDDHGGAKGHVSVPHGSEQRSGGGGGGGGGDDDLRHSSKTCRQHAVDFATNIFAAADKNGDGTLTKTEIRKYFKANPEDKYVKNHTRPRIMRNDVGSYNCMIQVIFLQLFDSSHFRT